jgi:hypothetical protein
MIVAAIRPVGEFQSHGIDREPGGRALLAIVTVVAGYGALTAQVQSDTQAIADLRSGLDKADQRIGQLEGRATEQGAALKEIETQFCSSDIVRNLMHADDLRVLALMWAKAFPGTVYPTDNAYYPRVCNRGDGQ